MEMTRNIQTLQMQPQLSLVVKKQENMCVMAADTNSAKANFRSKAAMMIYEEDPKKRDLY